VIIIGAARSGTNLLRDLLTSLDGFETWPCDELPFLWRHGNRSRPDDEFAPELATPPVRRYIRRFFRRSASPGTRFLVEKTCANSLRVGFVDRILPEARYLFIVRDGRDVVASAMKRWRAPFDLTYSLRKAPYVPLADLPYYAVAFLTNRLRRALSPERRLPIWGPVFRGMKDLSRNGALITLAARQWQRCVETSDRELREVARQRHVRIRYEELVADPVAVLSDLGQFLGTELAPDACARAAGMVRSDSVGKSRSSLSRSDLEWLNDDLHPTLAEFGYV
jgi:hypothetical protein